MIRIRHKETGLWADGGARFVSEDKAFDYEKSHEANKSWYPSMSARGWANRSLEHYPGGEIIEGEYVPAAPPLFKTEKVTTTSLVGEHGWFKFDHTPGDTGITIGVFTSRVNAKDLDALIAAATEAKRLLEGKS